MRARLLLGATAVLLGFACFRGGSVPWVGLAALLFALAAAARAPLPALGRAGGAALGLLAAFVAWNGISIAWSTLPDRSWEYLNLGLVYVAFACCGALAGALLPRAPRAVAGAFAVALAAVAVWALAGKVFAGIYPDYGRVARLRAPVGYWNALALLGDMALPLALWLAGRQRHRHAVRAGGTLLLYAWAVAIALTQSRGGVAVGIAVVLVWLALDAARLESLAALALAGAAAAGTAWLAFDLDGVTGDGSSDVLRAHDGHLFGIALLGIGAAVSAAAYALSVLQARAPVPLERRRLAERGALAAGAVAAAAVLVVAGLNAPRIWDSFSSSNQVATSGCRFCSAGSNFRTTWWQQAAHGFAERPLAGSGAGSFLYTNLKLRDWDVDYAIEPHDLPLQFLTETGIVGFLLAAGAAGLGLVAIVRRVRSAGADVAPAAALALVPLAYLLHGLVDYDWDFPAVTAPAVFVSAALVARPGRALARSVPIGLAAAAAAGAIFLSLLLPWLSQRYTLDAYGRAPETTIALARSARAYDPLAVEPIFLEAGAEDALGHPARAYALYRDATRIQPDNAETWFRLGRFWSDRGCPRHALPALERFVELNSQDPAGALKNEVLAQVNSGVPRC